MKARIVVGKNLYDNAEFECAHAGCDEHPKGGAFFRIIPHPEAEGSPETIICLCEEHSEGLYEGVVDLNKINITPELGFK